MFRSKILLSLILLLPALANATDRIWRNFLHEEREEMCAMNRPLVYSRTSLELCAHFQSKKIPVKQEQEARDEEPRLFWR